MLTKVFRLVVLIGGLSIIAAVVGGGFFAFYTYNRLTRDLPKISRISDYEPKAVSTLHADDGTLIAEIFDEQRYPAKFEDIPLIVKQGFLAAEDANFYSHAGIDFVSIVRAVWKNLTSRESKQGASTITQQIVKSLLLSREKTYERKAKEAILSYRLEKALSKDEILWIYLNEIYLGSNAYGIAAAAKAHFHKELSELTISEAAYLAGLPQRPSFLTNPKNRKLALSRHSYVLGQMLKNNFITQEQYEQARDSELVIYPAAQNTIYAVPYYAGHAIKEVKTIFEQLGMPGSEAVPGGYVIETAANIKAYEYAERAIKKNLRDLDKRHGWRGIVETKNVNSDWFISKYKSVRSPEDINPFEIYPAKVLKLNKVNSSAQVQLGEIQGVVDLKKSAWANRYADSKGNIVGAKPIEFIEAGDWIEVSLDQEANKGEKGDVRILRFSLDQTPQVQSAMTVLNALNGEVKAIIGGYDYHQSIFNRATQGLLQPGSAFKPIIYLSAVEQLNYTPSTIVPDSPISFPAGDGSIWSPKNFDGKYLGPITMRSALERSRNVVSVYLIDRIGVSKVIETARRLGLSTPIPQNMSIALGTPEVKQIELVRAYGAFAAEGWLADSIVVKKITDRKGNVIFEKQPHQVKAIDDPANAFIMANMMKGVVERGTAQRVKALNRPVAGKTGTTNEHMDAWFIGYTPEWVAGVWVGHDVKKGLGRQETGGQAAAPAFIAFMEQWLKDEPVQDFNIPDGVVPIGVDLRSGRLSSGEGAFTEYFKLGSEPKYTSQELEIPNDYLNNSEF